MTKANLTDTHQAPDFVKNLEFTMLDRKATVSFDICSDNLYCPFEWGSRIPNHSSFIQMTLVQLLREPWHIKLGFNESTYVVQDKDDYVRYYKAAAFDPGDIISIDYRSSVFKLFNREGVNSYFPREELCKIVAIAAVGPISKSPDAMLAVEVFQDHYHFDIVANHCCYIERLFSEDHPVHKLFKALQSFKQPCPETYQIEAKASLWNLGKHIHKNTELVEAIHTAATPVRVVVKPDPNSAATGEELILVESTYPLT